MQQFINYTEKRRKFVKQQIVITINLVLNTTCQELDRRKPLDQSATFIAHWTNKVDCTRFS